MRTLTSTLLAAQKKASAAPYLKVEAINKIAGVVNCEWSRLYSGTETEYLHAVTIPADGSLIRVRITPPDDGSKLYRQRVSNPTPASDFSQWAYTGQYSVLAAAAASLGNEVSVFWINLNRQVMRVKSTDCGASWGSPEMIDTSISTSVYGMATAYKPDGDLAVFFADQASLYVKRYAGGAWQVKSAWDKTTGDLSGVASVYDGDWDLLVTGTDSEGNFKLWGLVYGDGGDVAAGSWSGLNELASAPSNGPFQYLQPFLDKPDVHHAFFVEKFTGTEAYSRPFASHSVLDSRFIDHLWREPVPFNFSSAYGLALAHHGDYCWLTCPSGVWRADMTTRSIDVSADIIRIRQECGQTEGKLTVELMNDSGKYNSPGENSLSLLKPGCQLDFSPGYVTPNGNEFSPGQTFSLEGYEHITRKGSASLILHSRDGWGALNTWRARHQFRWNKSPDEKNVKEIIGFILARAGLKLDVKSQSSTITGYCPDFTIGPGDSGDTVIRTLLSFVPDIIFIEGHIAWLVNPLASDTSVYSYSGEHRIIEGRYGHGAWKINRVQVQGSDSGSPVVVDGFAWAEIESHFDRLKQVEDSNLDTVDKARDRADPYLRQAEMESAASSMLVPVNCGQQPGDVIDVTDPGAGLSAVKKRVLGMILVFDTNRAEYRQRLILGAP